MPPNIPTNPPAAALPSSISQKQVRKAKSWYTPNKASASTSVARENILGGTVRSRAAPDLSRFDSYTKKAAETASVRSTSQSTSLAEVPEEGRVSSQVATTDDSVDDSVDHAPRDKRRGTTTKPDASAESRPEDSVVADAASPSQDPARESTPTNQQRAAPPVGWLGWWSKAAPTTEQQKTTTVAKPDDTARHYSPASDDNPPVTPPARVAAPDPVPRDPTPSAAPSSSSWFGFWYSTDDKMKKTDAEKHGQSGADKNKQQEDAVMQDAPQEEAASAPGTSEHAPTPKAGSTWVFWARASPTSGGARDSNPEPGEMAVMGEGSEAQPARMREGDVSGPGPRSEDPKQDGPSSKGLQPGTKSTWRKKKRVRPASLDAAGDSDTSAAASPTFHEPQGLPSPPGRQKRPAAPPAAPPPRTADSSANSVAESETASKQPPNLLLPSFSSTYQMKENPSILQQIAQLLLRTSQPPPNHVFRVSERPRIRKAIAIGVHGLFPASYLRPMMGQPTGTSLRFANLCAEAIRRWADAHGSPDCEIEKVALEGEGRISDRVDNLWKLMLNWIDHIRNADLIIMACHSQGVPVSMMLLEKLIDLGVITGAKIGVCAMAGVAMGPFPEYKSSILMGSAAELWDFGNPQSANSQRFEASLRRVLEYGARVTFIGSIDDQVVPMESAIYSPASHPYIYRAVFIDGRIHAPDFIAHLVGFALKLRNLGVTDHGLVRELSIALAGSLYSGSGHSRLYYDPAVYDLAVCHALETTSTPGPVPCAVAARRHEGLSATNPYVLPWIMRGILEEAFVKTELSGETDELLRQFDDWKPSSKALKDVKYRLEAVRSKL
ncbi:hypothetical protein E4U41_001970 [Claviceps citrina]|nr:hypothetical protein E4U41_001970 [Claviceps citrina]